MLKIGITGGIGTGKTTVCRIFNSLGVPVFYADVAAKQAMKEDDELKSAVIKHFGIESYSSDGSLNNKHLAQIVFNDDNQLALLNSLVHPAVFRSFDNWVKTLTPNTPYCLKEAALLFESGSYKMCNRNILVKSPLQLRLDRVMKRDRVTETQVQARIDKQMPEEEKAKLADDFICNDETHSLITQVWTLHQHFLALSTNAR